jgi:hypothetical protein
MDLKTKHTKDQHYIPTVITTGLLEDIQDALKNIRGWGSIEIFVQRGRVTQITERNIKKTDHEIEPEMRS